MTGTYSGQFVMEVGGVSSSWNCFKKMYMSSHFNFHVCKGFPKPSLVPFHSSAADTLHRHHAYSAGRHFSGCWASDRDERLPQRASKHAGQQALTFLWIYRIKNTFSICTQVFVWVLDYNPAKYPAWLFLFFTASICFDTDSDLHQPEIYYEWLCKRNVSEISKILQISTSP